MPEIAFPPSRTAALERLAAFAPRAGRDYARLRNFDLPGHPHVSGLSPYIRHRVLTEREVLETVLRRWAPSSVEKFAQEVIWRAYFKGWMEHRPSVWDDYRSGVRALLNRIQTESGLRRRWEAACTGDTGIDAFDHWARELVATGYLHNHARMWFASIWIFTLRLPWELGADFFLRHLLDGDPASNTLGWRWVAGLHTRGKHYVARPANIAKYTEGRFFASGLAANPDPLEGPENPPAMGIRPLAPLAQAKRTGCILTEEDMSPGRFLSETRPIATLVASGVKWRSPLTVAPRVLSFTGALVEDMRTRHAEKLPDLGVLDDGSDAGDQILKWAEENALDQVVLPFLTAGPARDRLAPALAALSDRGIAISEVRRAYDDLIWPHATAGFFKVKKRIPSILAELGLT